MREPSANDHPKHLAPDRRRLAWLLMLLPLLVAGGAFIGGQLAVPVSKLNPTVSLAERYLNQQKTPVNYGVMTPEALGLQRAEHDPEALLKSATDLRGRFGLACVIFGGWTGLVIGIKLVSLSLRTTRTDFEPDRGACLACARCFRSCPQELIRIGQMPANAPVPTVVTAKV
jgi:ferredoxin